MGNPGIPLRVETSAGTVSLKKALTGVLEAVEDAAGLCQWPGFLSDPADGMSSVSFPVVNVLAIFPPSCTSSEMHEGGCLSSPVIHPR